MEKNQIKEQRDKKIELMQTLIDLYQQVETVKPEYAQAIVEDFIHKKEFELQMLIMESVTDHILKEELGNAK